MRRSHLLGKQIRKMSLKIKVIESFNKYVWVLRCLRFSIRTIRSWNVVEIYNGAFIIVVLSLYIWPNHYCIIVIFKLIFLQRDALHKLYSTYCQNIPRSEKLRESVGDHPFFRSCQVKLGHKLPLAAYLLKPVQRITKYQLLLKVCVSSMYELECVKSIVNSISWNNIFTLLFRIFWATVKEKSGVVNFKKL